MASTGLSTAGAIPVKNTKGEITMQKVKVQRYKTGQRPNYAEEGFSASSDSEDDLVGQRGQGEVNQILPDLSAVKIEPQDDDVEFSQEAIKGDRRLRRLMADGEGRGRRQVAEPEVLALGEERRRRHRDESESSEEDQDEDNVERRHAQLKQLRDEEEEELLGKEEQEAGGSDAEDEEESEYEEYSDDSEDDAMPRLKPVFVRKSDRVTILAKEDEEKKEEKRMQRAKREQEQRKVETLRIIGEENKKEIEEKESLLDEDEMMKASIAAVNTDDENEEASYELWKLRELKRIKRERDERDAYLKEKLEVERLRNMTEEERQKALEENPRVVTNKQDKGKYNFMQKYFHRGAFYLDQEDDVLKRDFAQPTLEDHFDKTVLPKVMQVKNFGRSGRTKYTHLVDQDTTAFDSPWAAESAQSKKFEMQAGGSKPIFERPSKKRKL